MQKPRNLSGSESGDRGHGDSLGSMWVCVLLCCSQIHVVQSYGRSKSDTRTLGVEIRKKPKGLSGSDREECGYGEGVSTDNVNESALCTTYDVVCS